MLRHLFTLLLLAFLIHPSRASERATEHSTANLRGVVYSESTNQRIVHATVQLCDEGGTPLTESITNDSGEFAFLRLKTEAFMLRVTAAGYDSAELHVDVSFGYDRGVSIFLKISHTAQANGTNGAFISAHELTMPESARKLVDAGMKKLYADKNPNGALKEFQRAVARDPDYYEAYYQIGLTYLVMQNLSDAEKNLEKSVELSQEKFAAADLALALLVLKRRDAVRGESLLRRAIELNPDSWQAYFELGKLEVYRNHLEPALQAAEKAKSLAPQQAVAYRLLSLVHLRLKDYRAALADLDSYIRLDPNSPESLTAQKIRSDAQHLLENSPPASVASSKPE